MLKSEDEEILNPLTAARDRLDAAIQGYLDKVASLRKRREAISASIDIIRGSDDEINSLPALAAKVNGKKPSKPKVYGFDEAAVEQAVVALLANGPASKPEIEACLRTSSYAYSIAGLRRILKTSPQIIITGERDSTRYQLKA